MSPTNQDGALALLRSECAALDPVFYSTKSQFHRIFMWLNLDQNPGWYCPVFEKGKMIGIHGMAMPGIEYYYGCMDWFIITRPFKRVSPKQQSKIELIMSNYLLPESFLNHVESVSIVRAKNPVFWNAMLDFGRGIKNA